MRGFRRLRIAALTIAMLGLSSLSARASEFYYVLIFGSQSHPKQLRYTHTWATFVRAVGEGPDANNYAIEAHTISWLPASLDVQVLKPWPEPGVNFNLDDTIRYVQSNNENITVWGPFLVSPEIYRRSLEVRGIVESGAVQYRAISTARNLLISDCIHAVAAVDPIFGRGHYPLIRIGKPASRYIAKQVSTRTLIDQSQGDNEWLIARLGLYQRCVEVIPPSAMPVRR